MMNRNLMLRILLILTVLSTVSFSYARDITFVDKDKSAIPDVRCIGYTENNDSVACWTSAVDGKVDLGNAVFDHILASHSGYSDKIIFAKNLNEGNTFVTLTPGVELSEVVITPDDIKEFVDHTTYRISQKEMERYPTVLESLNEIPSLTVLSNGQLFYEGNSNVKILIDGVDATAQEIQSLSKEDISRVDVYKIPPARFMNQGVSSVLDIRLKSKLHGGNVALNVTQAFQSLIGDNSAALFYNYKSSRFSLLYNNENAHYNRIRKSEVLDYAFEGVNYVKTKEGLDSKEHKDNNDLKFSYQINKPGNFLYNVKAGVSLLRHSEKDFQNVMTPFESFLASNFLHTDYTKYLVGNYFEKNLGEKAGVIMANVNYQHFSNFYNSIYNELSDSEIAVNDSRSKYKTHLDEVFSEMQYQLPYSSLGQFTVSLFETYRRSKYVDSVFPFSQTYNVFGGAAQWVGMKRNVSWYLSMGASWYHTISTNVDKANNLCVPTPSVTVNWRPFQNMSFRFNYSFSGVGPSISQLSETNQWLDSRLVYHGNSELKPYKTHLAALTFGWAYKYLDLTVYGAYTTSPGMICDMYTLKKDYMLQTIVNLNKYTSLSSQMDFTVKPLGNNKLLFWNRVILADVRGENKEYKWKGYRFQWMSDLSLNLTHWTFDLFYQYPGKVVEGQLELPRAQSWSATVLYRPKSNLSFGVSLLMPFGNGFKESQRTVNAAPVYADTEVNVMDFNNLVSFKLNYNISYGRNRNNASPRYDNYDNDSGILRR